MREDYVVKIVESLRPLTAKEKLIYKGNVDTKPLNELVTDTFEINEINNIIILDIHNEHAENDKDYTTAYIITPTSDYSTSSESTIGFLKDLIADFDEDEFTGDWGLSFFRKKSKNNQGSMLLCNIC